MLVSALAEYETPRAKITSLLKKGVIIRVKKGLYVFGDSYRRRPFSRELLANFIVPSYISLDYALYYHGLIPERVAQVTPTTPKRPKRFSTPIGASVYRQTRREGFHIGMQRVETGEVAFLMAGPERALADKLRVLKRIPCRTLKELGELLFDDWRLDETRFGELVKYSLKSADDYLNAIREILQEIVLCGLWRTKFYEKAAFYGGTALRVLYGLDRLCPMIAPLSI